MYYSHNKKAWFGCVVIGQDSHGDVEVDLQGTLRSVSAENVATYLRRPSGYEAEQTPVAAQQRLSVGASVLIKRSSGEWSKGAISEIRDDGNVSVTMEAGVAKMVLQADVSEYIKLA